MQAASVPIVHLGTGRCKVGIFVLFYKEIFLLNMNDAGHRAAGGGKLWMAFHRQAQTWPAMEDMYGLSGAVPPLSTGAV